MPERKTLLSIDSFRVAKNVSVSPAVSQMVAEGDRDVYSVLDPLSEAAFDYRDTIEIENHIAGISVVKRRVEKGNGPLLYLASSYGLGPLLLKNAGYNVVSLDKDIPSLRFAKKYVPEQLRANGTILPFVDNSFTAVVSRDFLAQDYHLLTKKDRQATVSEIHRTLKKDGLAIFYTLYCAQMERDLGREIAQGLPAIPMLLDKFDTVETVNVRYKDSRRKNTSVIVAVK